MEPAQTTPLLARGVRRVSLKQTASRSPFAWGKKLVRGAFLIVLVFIYFFPFYWMLSTSLKTATESIFLPPVWFPENLQFENYAEAFRRTNFLHALQNSVIVTFSAIAAQFIICIPAAYAFAMKKFRFMGILLAIVLCDLMIPGQVTFIPIYVLISNLGWLDSYWALIVPFAYSSFNIFFLVQTFKQIPSEIVDAAKLDHANELRVIYAIMVPMCKPVVFTTALLTFIDRWNDYFWALILTTTDKVRTLPLSVGGLVSGEGGIPQWHVSMAGNVMLTAPLLILYLLASRQIKDAFVYGGIK